MHPWNQPILDSLRGRLDRLPHAILLHGPRGVGKLALAETMAQLLLCEHKDPKARPCGQCDGCRWFARPPLDRSGTLSMRMSLTERRDERAGKAFAPTYAASR